GLLRCWLLGIIAAFWGVAAFCQASDMPPSQAQQIDLTKIFATRSPWRLVVTQGVETKDAFEAPAPGALEICLEKVSGGRCISGVALHRGDTDTPPLWGPHYILSAKPVYPEGTGHQPLFELVTSSLDGVNGDHVVATQ